MNLLAVEHIVSQEQNSQSVIRSSGEKSYKNFRNCSHPFRLWRAVGLDDGADVGVELGSLFGAEAAGDFAEHGAGTQCALGTVVRRRNVAVR
jgi:hypothetical protein